MTRRLTRRTTVAVATLGGLLLAAPALAYWLFSGSASTAFQAGSLGGPGVTVPAFSTASVNVSWATVTAPGGGAVDGYYVERLSGATPTAACSSSPTTLLTGTSCTDTATAGSYTYRVTAVFRSWTTPATSASAVLVDTTAPIAFSATLSGATGSTFVNGSTVYTNPQAGKSGGFTVTSAPTDPESGIQQVTFPSIANYTGGGADTTSPYTTTYAWSGATANASGTQTVVAQNRALATTSASFVLAPDVAAPTGGTVTASNSMTGTVPVSTTSYTDAASGLATTGTTRAASTLSGGTCGSLTGATAVSFAGANDSQTLTTGCYQYTLTAIDNVGNIATTTSTVVKVDTTVPALTYSTTGANIFSDGTSVVFKAGSGSTNKFTVTVDDPESGLTATPTFPTIAGWTKSGTGTSATYTLGAGTAAGTVTTSVGTVTNNAGGSATLSIVTSADSAAPTATDIQGTANDFTPNSGDQIAYTFSELVSPGSILTGWSGASTAVTAHFDNDGNVAGDSGLTITGTNIGNVDLGDTGATKYSSTHGARFDLTATMVMTTVSGHSVVTVTLSSSTPVRTVSSNTTLKWVPTNSITDLVGNAASTTAVSQISGPKKNF
jgi:hypothetical protein